jgi:hypothetical protein
MLTSAPSRQSIPGADLIWPQSRQRSALVGGFGPGYRTFRALLATEYSQSGHRCHGSEIPLQDSASAADDAPGEKYTYDDAMIRWRYLVA